MRPGVACYEIWTLCCHGTAPTASNRLAARLALINHAESKAIRIKRGRGELASSLRCLPEAAADRRAGSAMNNIATPARRPDAQVRATRGDGRNGGGRVSIGGDPRHAAAPLVMVTAVTCRATIPEPQVEL